MKPVIYVDGQEGTTGLQIHERLQKIRGIDTISIDPDKRKDNSERKKLINQADIVFLCLPDQASREAVSFIENPKTRVIDASTAYRTDPDWVYGLPELGNEQYEKINKTKRLANPGCHATGFNLALYPLIKAGLVGKNYPVTAVSLTGYSGGGKKLIQTFEQEIDRQTVNYPRPYALGLTHKHLPEMQSVCGLTHPPILMPILGNVYKGMAVSIPLEARLLERKTSIREIHEILSSHYNLRPFVKVMPLEEDHLDNGMFRMFEANDTNRNDIFVYGNDTQYLIVSRLDNLGKGASGAAIQNMNIMLGFDEKEGLTD